MTGPGSHPVGGVGVEFDDGTPTPPPGPGVAPPFAAPPTDRNRRSLWLGLGLGALALLVCCAGGLTGFGVIIVNGTDQLKRQATSVVREYYRALVARDYGAAYELLCPALTANMSQEQFISREQQAPHPVSYRLGSPELSNAIVVPVSVTYDSGSSQDRRVRLEQVRSTGRLSVCGGAD